MLSQNLVQVYINEEGDAVVVIGVYEGVGKSINPHHIVIPFQELMLVSKALNDIYEELQQERS